MILEACFAGVVLVVLPARAWRRHRRGAPAAPAARYIAETLALVGVLTFLLWRREVAPAAIGLRAMSPMRFVGDLAGCLAVIVGLDVYMVWRITRQIQQAAALPAPEGLAADALAGSRARLPFLAVAIVGAVWEELCFRATVFLLVPPTPGGLLLGVGVGSLAFGAQHLRNGWSGVIYSTGFGLLFALLFLATGNLPAVVMAHAAGNVLTAWQWAPRIERARQQALRRQQEALRRPVMFLG